MKMNKLAVIMASCMLFTVGSMQANAAPTVTQGEQLATGTVSMVFIGEHAVSVTSTDGQAKMDGTITTPATFTVTNTSDAAFQVGVSGDGVNGQIVWKLEGDTSKTWTGAYIETDDVVKWDSIAHMAYNPNSLSKGESAVFKLAQGKTTVAVGQAGKYTANLKVFEVSL